LDIANFAFNMTFTGIYPRVEDNKLYGLFERHFYCIGGGQYWYDCRQKINQ